ncbi:purple acid phosphatase family protein [Candidatus Thiosymbion oneisti]|uniref:purple acid phosphatase family protein n=1 Tax=Candidatus Thiosymbion oneisti TaxID=589554 RepID=UPI00159F2900|nr:metallophosphoesterase family protein [Candidatus Thiosymbion oneisti]
MRTTIRFTIPALLLAFALSAAAHNGEHQDLRHWELASPDPDRIFLTFHGDPATRRAVTWRTDTSVKRPVAEIAVALGEPGFDQMAERVEAKTQTIDLSKALDTTQGEVRYHSAIFQNLRPGTLYAYRVGDGDKRWSEWIQFRTASKEPRPFSFIYFGDAQNDVLSRWSRVIRMAHQTAPDAAFALHAGDLIDRANADTEWAEWFKAGGYLHAQWTGIPVTGNHEYAGVKSMLWRPQFTLPVESSLPQALHETVYTVDYQGVRIIVLNSNEKVSEQVAYLEAQLKKPGYRWSVVTFHHPIFSPMGRKNYDEQDRQKWKALFAKHKVDFVLQGHDHSYVRGQVPVIDNDGTPGSDFQTLYVTSVSGPKQYKIKQGQLESYASEGYTTQRKARNTQFFQVIEIDGDRASYKAYTATGALYDAAVIEKNHATGEKKIIQRIPHTDERTYENTVKYSTQNL